MADTCEKRPATEKKESKPRSTPVRRCLLATLAEASAPLSAADFLSALEEAGLSANKTTVYRQLDALVEQGVLRRLDLGDGKKRYETAHEGKDHPHIICTQCGAVACLPDDSRWAVYKSELEKDSGFDISECSVELYGICSLCKGEGE